MNKPVLFGETINKKTASRNKLTIPYERGMLSQEDRVFVENVVNDVKQSKVQTGYNGNVIRKEVIDFEVEFPGLIFKDVDFLYDRMMKDARNVFPRNRELKNKVAIYYEEMIRQNLNNLYHYAPKFFADNFVTKNYINNAAFEAYQIYIFLLCFIHWTDIHRLDTDVRELDNIDKILNWIATRRDPSIEYIINGPSGNSDLSLTDFRAHYRTLIDTSNEMSEIIAYNQLSSTQTISSDLYNLLHLIQSLPNVYYKNPDEARKYNINIDSAKDVLVSIDNDNNLIFDCSYVNLGDVTEQNKLAKFDNLESVITNNKVNSMINTKKLAELFHNYSRIKILELVMTPDTYISSLDAFSKVFVVFKGVSCSERNVYNTIPTNYLKIGGKFIKTKRGYEFQMDVDAITYKSVLADVKSFEVYLTLDPNYTNQIIPNEYALTFSKHKIYQHPITTDVVYDSKVRGIRKILTERSIVDSDADNNDEDGINSDRETISVSQILGLTNDMANNVSLVVNNRWSPKNEPRNRLPIHASTNDPKLDAFILGTDYRNVKRTLTEVLMEKTKKSTNTKDAVIHSIDECLEIANQCRDTVANANMYLNHFLLRVIKLLNDVRDSWTYDEKLTKIALTLTTSSHLDRDTKTELFKGVNSSAFVRVPSLTSVIELLLNNYPSWAEMETIHDTITSSSLSDDDFNHMKPAILHILTLDVENDLDMKTKFQLSQRIKGGLSALNDGDAELIKRKTEELMLAVGNKAELLERLTAKSLISEDVEKLINAVNIHISLSFDTVYAAINALYQYANQADSKEEAELAKRAAENIYYGKVLSEREQNIAIKANDQYITIPETVKETIVNHVETSTTLSKYEQTTLKLLINRSFVLSDNEKQLIINAIADASALVGYKSLIADAVIADQYMNDVYKNQIKEYNTPFSPNEDISQLIKNIRGYQDFKVLNDDIEHDKLTAEEIDQLLTIMPAYYNTLEHDIDFTPSTFIAFINELNNSSYYDITDELKYYYDPDTDDDVFTQFFTDITPELLIYCSDATGFIRAYESIRNDKAIIMNQYMRYFNNLFDVLIENDTTTTIANCVSLFKIFKSIYQWLFARLLNSKALIIKEPEYQYRNVEVDLNTGTIEGRYFDVDSNGFITFNDNAGPNPEYLIYSEDENDLTLFNLYTKYNETLNPVSFGTFIYSESLKTIQNLNYPIYDYSGYQNRIKFDNSYTSEAGNYESTEHIYYRYHNTQIGFKSEATATRLEAGMDTGERTSTILWEKSTQDTIVITPKNSSQFQTILNSFAAECTIKIYSSSATSIITEFDADCVFIKNPDALNSNTDINYCCVGIIRSVSKDAYITGVSENMLIHTETVFGGSTLTTSAAYIEPSCYGVIGETVINDTFNNQTRISEYFDVSFVNTIGFTTLEELEASDVQYSEADRGEYSYRVDYNYDRNSSCLEIKNTISKVAVNEQYIESILVYFNYRLILRKTVIQNSITSTISFTEHELLSIRDSIDSTITYVDTFHFGEVVKYTDKDDSKGNEYKAFYIDGIDAKSQYWNKTAYIHSLMLCPVSTCSSSIYPESDYEPFTGEIIINGQTESTRIYNYTDGFTLFTDKFKIRNDGIYVSDDDNNYNKSGILNVFVNDNDKLICSYEPKNATYSTDDVDKTKTLTITLFKDNNKGYFTMTLTIVKATITQFTLATINDPYMTNTNIDFGTYAYPPVSEQPIYLYSGDKSVEVIISFENAFSDFPTAKSITINSVSVSTIRYRTTHYVYNNETGVVSYRDVQTVRYSNIPGDYCDSSDVLFALLGQEGMIFKYNPIFKYYENIIVSPRHVDQNNNFIMVVQKYNQNVLGKPVYLRSQYNLNNPNVNTLRDSDTIEYKIAQTLDPTKTHLMESVNKQMLMFGGVENYGPIGSVAIKAGKVHAIPTASKMMLSLEFS